MSLVFTNFLESDNQLLTSIHSQALGASYIVDSFWLLQHALILCTWVNDPKRTALVSWNL
jgi:hypothetical protein